MITFVEAMLIAHGELLPLWEGGTLHILSSGMEDDRGYLVYSGHKEYVIDKNVEFVGGDMPVVLVDKQTGEARLENIMYLWDRLDHMRKVSLTPTEVEQFYEDVNAQ